jgi:hypothetical protein
MTVPQIRLHKSVSNHESSYFTGTLSSLQLCQKRQLDDEANKLSPNMDALIASMESTCSNKMTSSSAGFLSLECLQSNRL